MFDWKKGYATEKKVITDTGQKTIVILGEEQPRLEWKEGLGLGMTTLDPEEIKSALLDANLLMSEYTVHAARRAQDRRPALSRGDMVYLATLVVASQKRYLERDEDRSRSRLNRFLSSFSPEGNPEENSRDGDCDSVHGAKDVLDARLAEDPGVRFDLETQLLDLVVCRESIGIVTALASSASPGSSSEPAVAQAYDCHYVASVVAGDSVVLQGIHEQNLAHAGNLLAALSHAQKMYRPVQRSSEQRLLRTDPLASRAWERIRPYVEKK